MINNLILSAEIVLPLLIWMMLGYLVRIKLMLNEEWVRKTNRAMFTILFPLLMFRNVYGSDFSMILNAEIVGLVGFAMAASVTTFLALMILTPKFVPDGSRCGVLVQGILRGNMVLFGIPVAAALYGEGSSPIITLLLSVSMIPFNIFSIIVLGYFQGVKPTWRKIVKSIIINPLMLATCAGLLLNLLDIGFPSPIKMAAWSLADCATPLAYFVLGASFSLTSSKHNRIILTVSIFLRLVLIPLVWVVVGALLGYRGQSLVGILIWFGTSTAVACHLLVVEVGGDQNLSSEMVVFSSALSIITMFLWIFVLKSLALI